MKCPKCGEDLTSHIASEFGKIGGKAAAAALTKRQRVLKARKAGKANKGISRPSEKRGEAMRAYWASLPMLDGKRVRVKPLAVAIAKKANAALQKRSKAEKAKTREKRSVAMAAIWAARRIKG